MIHEKHLLLANGWEAPAYTYLLDNTPEVDMNRQRPIVIICPGGAYGMTSDREAEPIAIQMNAMGFHALIVRYSVAPARFPVALLQVAQAVALAKKNAAAWHVDTSKIFVMGFSAGGHLTASLGVFWNKGIIEKEIGGNAEDYKPSGLILSYPVITSGKQAHRGSFANLLAEKEDELGLMMSLEMQVDAETPPCFIWHTYEDSGVPVENSLLFAAGLRKFDVPFELHVYQYGQHGLSLSTPEVGTVCPPNVSTWVSLAGGWISAFRQA